MGLGCNAHFTLINCGKENATVMTWSSKTGYLSHESLKFHYENYYSKNSYHGTFYHDHIFIQNNSLLSDCLVSFINVRFSAKTDLRSKNSLLTLFALTLI